MSSTDDATSIGSSPPVVSAQPLESGTDALSEQLVSPNQPLTVESASSVSSQSSNQENDTKKATSTRPNKYDGPSSTWRGWTATERQLAASLDQIQANDLSVHLYNFFHVKQDANNQESAKAWASAEGWTAWPMEPTRVPRVTDNIQWEAKMSTEIGPGAMGPRELLQDILAARVLKKAKERFLSRHWEDPSTEKSASPRDRRFSRQSRVAMLAGDASISSNTTPVIMADDEFAKGVLQPSLNQMMNKLDALLASLHQARNSYATYNKALTKMTTDKKSNKRKRGRNSSRPGDTEITTAPSNQSRETSPEHPGADGAYSNIQRRHRLHRPKGTSSQNKADLGLRDWSDVVGVASMCGWDSAVVARAAARCSDLFEERISFRTLYEGSAQDQEIRYEPEIFAAENFQTAKSDDEQISDEVFDTSGATAELKGDMVGGVHVDGFLQPIKRKKSWSRSSRAQSQR